MKAMSFNLRPAPGEKRLSFYIASEVNLVDVLRGAPGAGWGIVAVPTGALKSLGFSVEAAEVPDDALRGMRTYRSRRPSTTKTDRFRWNCAKSLQRGTLGKESPSAGDVTQN